MLMYKYQYRLLLISLYLNDRFEPSEMGRTQFCISSLYCTDRLFGRYSMSFIPHNYTVIIIICGINLSPCFIDIIWIQAPAYTLAWPQLLQYLYRNLQCVRITAFGVFCPLPSEGRGHRFAPRSEQRGDRLYRVVEAQNRTASTAPAFIVQLCSPPISAQANLPSWA